jgi:hypothetical protein
VKQSEKPQNVFSDGSPKDVEFLMSRSDIPSGSARRCADFIALAELFEKRQSSLNLWTFCEGVMDNNH